MATKDFAEKIYSLRTARGLSQKELGDLLGVSNKAVSKWETGDSMPKTATLVKIADTFGIDISELMGAETRDPLPDNTAQLDSLKAENALLRSQITASDKRKKRRTVAAVIIGIVAIACAGVFAFLTGSTADNKGVKDLGKDGTYIEFAGKTFETPNPLDKLMLDGYNAALYDKKEAQYTDLSGNKTDILIDCDRYLSGQIRVSTGTKSYYYIEKDAHIAINAKTVRGITLHFGKSVAIHDDLPSGIKRDYDAEDVIQREFIEAFCTYYANKKESDDKRAAELYLGNQGFTVEIELDRNDMSPNITVGEFFVGHKDKIYFYDYTNAKTYTVGKEMAKYVKGN